MNDDPTDEDRNRSQKWALAYMYAYGRSYDWTRVDVERAYAAGLAHSRTDEKARRDTEREKVAWVEIHSGDLHCTCGHIEFLGPSIAGGKIVAGTLVSKPSQKCPKCKRKWFCPGAADCEEGA